MRISYMRNESFTLIELMVVIALIGLVAAIVLVSLRGARQRARIAAAMQFSDSLRAGLADALVSWWSFDEGAGTVAGDPWGGNNGTILNYGTPCSDPPTPGCPKWDEGIVRGAISFDGSDDWVRVPHHASLKPTEAITIEAWVYPRSFSDSYAHIVGVPAAWGNRKFIIYRSNRRVSFRLKIGGVEKTLDSESAVSLNSWTHIACTYSSAAGRMLIYINGQKEKTELAVTGSIDPDVPISSPYTIGASSGISHRLNGLIDEVRIYNRGLTALEIQKRYAEGLEKYKLAEK